MAGLCIFEYTASGNLIWLTSVNMSRTLNVRYSGFLLLCQSRNAKSRYYVLVNVEGSQVGQLNL